MVNDCQNSKYISWGCASGVGGYGILTLALKSSKIPQLSKVALNCFEGHGRSWRPGRIFGATIGRGACLPTGNNFSVSLDLAGVDAKQTSKAGDPIAMNEKYVPSKVSEVDEQCHLFKCEISCLKE